MHVVATAGHVDHGKSTLVRALTGSDPDRWAEEHRRGLTIDLGYAWTTLPGGAEVAFVDVPGHRRFIGNMLAGIGPAPAVLFVVAADAGWARQSAEHLRVLRALGVRHALLVVTRSDLADPGAALEQGRAEFARAGLPDVPTVAVSARTGAGLDDVRHALDALVAGLPVPDAQAPIRLWIDRSFTMTGAGTVVTGTLREGSIAVGDRLALRGPTVDGERVVTVRGLESLGRPAERVGPVSRVAVNLRGVSTDDVSRGDLLLATGLPPAAAHVDVRRAALKGDRTEGDDEMTATDPVHPSDEPVSLPAQLTLHVGTVAMPARARPLGASAWRLTLAHPLFLATGDRALLRDPGDESGEAIVGVVVADTRPPELTRRGEAARRGEHLTRLGGDDDATSALAAEVARRGALTIADAERLGHHVPDGLPGHAEFTSCAGWLVADETWTRWRGGLDAACAVAAARDPLDPSPTVEGARAAAGVPDLALVGPLAAQAGLQVARGRLLRPGVVPDLGRADAGLRRIEERLAATPFDAPEQGELDAAGLGPRQLAAAEALGRLVRLGDGIVLRPDGPARAMRSLAGLPQPFTTSQARQALSTTRRVAIPLLEHLDSRGWTRRLDAGHREVVR